MTTLRINGTELYYEEQGTGQQAVVFAHGLCMSGRMFHNQVLALRERFRCITFDFRGQGRSAVAAGGYDMDTLTRDAAALIRRLDCAPCHFVGLSMGGFVGLRLALRERALLRSLTLIATSADSEPAASRRRYRMLATIARLAGLRPVVGPVMRLLFGRSFLTDPERAELRARWREELLHNHRVGIARAARGVIDRDDVAPALGSIEDLPTLVLVGEEDLATPPVRSRRLAGTIAGADLVVVRGAGHSPCIEEPQQVSHALLEFLESLHR